MIDDATIVARYEAEEARLGGFTDKNGVINFPRVLKATAEALGVTQERAANTMRAHWAKVGGG